MGSLYILFTFLCECLLQMLIHGENFFKNPGLLFDFVVVVISIAFEISFTEDSEVGLILLARFWRYIRLFHGGHEAQHQHSSGKHGNDHKTAPKEESVKNPSFSNTAQSDNTDESGYMDVDISHVGSPSSFIPPK